ncbi:hypothetical protein OG943_16050 [Amycolatopsis sp. NBC_00345]|uniref:hypothetical protein n=1 Tax=Amycolatopsis sp. NBC_00345 TaxID=2975955 RepID=UPI002E2726AA
MGAAACAAVALLGGLEAFCNWRSRQLLMEESQCRMNRVRDDLDYYLVTTPAIDLKREKLDSFYAEQQVIWAEVSRQWAEFRKLDCPPQVGQVPTSRDLQP